MITDAGTRTTIDRLIYLAVLNWYNMACFTADPCCIKDSRLMIHNASVLRQSLSDELHARAFYDFEGAGRFIRFVYLVGNDDSALLDYVNDCLQTRDV